MRLRPGPITSIPIAGLRKGTEGEGGTTGEEGSNGKQWRGEGKHSVETMLVQITNRKSYMAYQNNGNSDDPRVTFVVMHLMKVV